MTHPQSQSFDKNSIVYLNPAWHYPANLSGGTTGPKHCVSMQLDADADFLPRETTQSQLRIKTKINVWTSHPSSIAMFNRLGKLLDAIQHDLSPAEPVSQLHQLLLLQHCQDCWRASPLP